MLTIIIQIICDFIMCIVAGIISAALYAKWRKIKDKNSLKISIDCDLEFIADSLYAACLSKNGYFITTQLSRTMFFIKEAWAKLKLLGDENMKFTNTVLYSILYFQ